MAAPLRSTRLRRRCRKRGPHARAVSNPSSRRRMTSSGRVGFGSRGEGPRSPSVRRATISVSPGRTNAWMRPLLAEPGWTAAWNLNPDTYPEPDALAELADYASKRGKGMVGSRLMIPGRSDVASSRGLQWNKLTTRLMGLDMYAPVSPAPDPEDIERRMDSPTGPSMYVTRECIKRIGLMDDSYFLYWEEVDWGVRAKAACGSATPMAPSCRISAAALGHLQQAGGAFGLHRLSWQSQQASLRAPALPGLVRVDGVRVLPQNRRISGGRIDAQFRRREQGHPGRLAGREGSPEGAPTQASV